MIKCHYWQRERIALGVVSRVSQSEFKSWLLFICCMIVGKLLQVPVSEISISYAQHKYIIMLSLHIAASNKSTWTFHSPNFWHHAVYFKNYAIGITHLFNFMSSGVQTFSSLVSLVYSCLLIFCIYFCSCMTPKHTKMWTMSISALLLFMNLEYLCLKTWDIIHMLRNSLFWNLQFSGFIYHKVM